MLSWLEAFVPLLWRKRRAREQVARPKKKLKHDLDCKRKEEEEALAKDLREEVDEP